MSKFFWAARIGARGGVWLRSFAEYLGRARDFVRAGALRGGGGSLLFFKSLLVVLAGFFILVGDWALKYYFKEF